MVISIRIKRASNNIYMAMSPTDVTRLVQYGTWVQNGNKISLCFKNSIYNNSLNMVYAGETGSAYLYLPSRLNKCLINSQSTNVAYRQSQTLVAPNTYLMSYPYEDRYYGHFNLRGYIAENTNEQVNDFVSQCPQMSDVPNPVDNANIGEVYKLPFILNNGRIKGFSIPTLKESSLQTSVSVPSSVSITKVSNGFKISADAFSQPTASWIPSEFCQDGVFERIGNQSSATTRLETQPTFLAFFGFNVIGGVSFWYNTETYEISNITLRHVFYFTAFSAPLYPYNE